VIRVIGPREDRALYKGVFVDTTAKTGLWSQLSPFLAGPCQVTGTTFTAERMENAWQFAKVLWDWDGYDHWNLGMELGDVLACSSRKMGHGFVLAAMLQYGPAVRPEDVFRRRGEQLQLLDAKRSGL